MAISTFVFWLTALMTVSSALVVVGARNILHAAFALCNCFLGVGAFYVMLHADFVAAVQLIVYVGGILVLIMFAIMFSSNVNEDTSAERRGWFSIFSGAAVALAVFIGLCCMVKRLDSWELHGPVLMSIKNCWANKFESKRSNKPMTSPRFA